MPTVDIVIANHNYARYLEKSIASALDQTHPCRVVVVDDGSTDDSLSILARYQTRTTVIEKSNGGQASAFNAGFAAGDGDLVIFLDADDVLLPDAAAMYAHAYEAAPDATRLHALHLKRPAPDGFVFYLHGNAGNLEGWFVNLDFWRRLNLDVFMLDYRGYGKSGGRVTSEVQLHDDVRAAWDQVASAYDGKRRIVFGRSLGTALAARLAADVQPDLTVLVSPYESLAALAREHYAWVPSALLRYPLRTDEAVARLPGPLLLLHGEHDELIAPHHSDHLLAKAPPAARARLVRIPGAGHNDLQQFDAYLDALATELAARR